MEIILKQDIQSLGNKDDIIKVKDGYARNFLIPKGIAIIATKASLKSHKEILKQRAHKIEKMRNEASLMLEDIQKVSLKIGAKTSSTGKIFGSVNTIMLAEALKEKGFDIDRKNINIKGESIKEIGSYTAIIKLFRDIKAEINFEVLSE